jgi:Proteasome subunit
VACTYNGGVILAADGKVSVGNYVSNRASNKLAPMSDNVFILRSGSAPDTQAIADYGVFLDVSCLSVPCPAPVERRVKITGGCSTILCGEPPIRAGT